MHSTGSHHIWGTSVSSMCSVRCKHSCSAFLVRSLYVHRISIVSRGRSRALPIMVGIAVLLAAGVAIAIVWRAYEEVHVITDLVKIQWTVYMFLGTVAFVDILIASSIWYLLATSRTGFSRTDLFITKLMSYIINTGCLTSICSMIVIITCAVMPKNYIFEAVGFLLIKLYVNSYIALLNARYYVQANTDMFKYPDDEVLHITRPIQAVMPQQPVEVTMEMSSLSSA
ncbi:hypothetical protein EDB19DRAFT_176329 [Suillus lakei]|nr:hypothetical protein EDB19DRAFT_176329 [Suillus lakei]